MITEKDIRPIPKYILKKIFNKDSKLYPTPYGYVRFYAYLACWKRELVKVTVAVKHHNRKWYCKQVAVHLLHSEQGFVKDMEYCYLTGMGFRVGWYAEGINKMRKWYEDGKWYTAKDSAYDPYALVVNLNVIDEFPQFKYSAYKQYNGVKILQYLRLYERFPQIEFLVKFNFKEYATSIQLLRLIGIDKHFRKWLCKNRDEILKHKYYCATIIHAYKWNWSLEETQAFESRKKEMIQQSAQPLTTYFKGKELAKLFNYIDEKKIDYNSYNDYLEACLKLELDMSKKKNLFPHDFFHWHDIRLDKYASKKTMLDEKERQKFLQRFAGIAQKYSPMQNSNGKISVFIAKSPNELVEEGKILGHCVGGGTYEQRFARQQSLSFFVRNAKKPDTPLFTIEYSIKQKVILQCYGLNHKRPQKDIEDYVYNQWLPYANKTLNMVRNKKIKIAA